MDLIGQLFTLFGSAGDNLLGEISAGRMVESVVLLWIIWRKLSPHLEKIEARLAGLESAVKEGFNSGDERFKRIENRIDRLEDLTQP